MKTFLKKSRIKNQRGAVGLMVTLLIIPFVGLAAFGYDTYRTYVLVSNELQNAADAGALAGAAVLYNTYGTAINTGANLVAKQVAVENLHSDQRSPEVVASAEGNTLDVQRGHWSFGLSDSTERGFYPSESTTLAPLTGVPTEELDDPDHDPIFINAVRVVARREVNPIINVFAQIFGEEWVDHGLNREAVAYIGFAGRLNPLEVDQPIAICEGSILDPNDGSYDCNIGRMINSGNDPATSETGGWTDFNQDQDTCGSGTNSPDVQNVICAEGNPSPIIFGEGMAMINGNLGNSAWGDLHDCWDEGNIAEYPETGYEGTIITGLSDAEVYDWCYESQGYSTLDDLIAAQPPGLRAIMETYNSEDRADRELQEKLNYIRRTWEMVLPVIACSGQSVNNCEEVRGAVGVDVAWITQLGTDPQYNEVPRALFGQNCERLWPDADVMADATQTERIAMWDSFRRDSDLNLRNVTTEEGQTPYAPYDNFSLYFLPSCERFDPRGGSGGENFGILAKIPVLVCPDPTSQDAYGEDANNCLGGTGGT